MTVDVDRITQEAIEVYHAAQKPTELAGLGQLIVVDKNYKTAIEIGTWGGGTSWFLHAIGLEVTTIDDCDEAFLGECLAKFGFKVTRIPEITYLVGSSKSIELGNADVVFIDGDHTYDGAMADWMRWHSHVNPGGIVVFHDIIADVPENMSEVKRVFDEIAVDYKTTTFIDPTDEAYPYGGFDDGGNRRPWGGIGVVHL